MGREKGGKKKGAPKTGGRVKGTPNLLTSDIKERFKLIVETNLDNINLWLSEVARDNPAKALDFIKDLAEYNVPKLARTELTGKDGEELKINIITEDKAANEIINKI